MSDSADAPVCPICADHADEWFHVAGMDCGDEVALLEGRLGRMDGVERMSADLIGQRLKVGYDAARISTGDIVHAIAETGMRAWPENATGAAPVAGVPTRLTPLVVSGSLLAAGFALRSVGAPLPAIVPLFVGAAIAAGLLTARRAWASVVSRTLDMYVLMLVAVVGAAGIGAWDEAGTVMFLFALAQWLESRSMARARHAIRALMDVPPAEATIRRDGEDRRVAVDLVRVGDTLVVRPGEKFPLDGRVVSGRSAVNQAPITGESVPVEKGPADEVFAGTLNGNGALEVEVTRLRRDTRLAHIISLVEHAQSQRAPAQAFVDRFARVYTPAVMALAVLVAVVPVVVMGQPFATWFYRALVLLVIACPCALVISTPVAFVSALAGAARRGVLIKGGLHLERAGRVRVVAFDKTGTLTEGCPEVVTVLPVGGSTEVEVLAVAASLESRSNHPIAAAIMEHAALRAVASSAGDEVHALPGLGAAGLLDGAAALVGSRRLFEDRGLLDAEVEAVAASLYERGQTVVLVARAGRVIGLLGVADRSRSQARAVVEALERLGIGHVVMLTGDSAAPSRLAAAGMGIGDVRAGLMPEDKVVAVAALRREHGAVMMVGDGVNDAPALAAADLGVAMGAGASDVALETADAALVSDQIERIPYLVRLGRATRAVVRENIALALGLKGAFLALALTGQATLWMAVTADMGASLLVIFNGLRLLRRE